MLNRLSNTSILKVAALVGVLMALLLLASTIFAQTPDPRNYRYAENGTDPVATFRATTDVKWSLKGADGSKFDISSSGVLTFKSPPNFEEPGDVAATVALSDLNDDDDIIDSREAATAGNNVYQVYIVADTTILVAAEVTVTDVDDPGVVTLSHLQPAEGVEYKATAKDEDDGYRSADDQLHLTLLGVDDPDPADPTDDTAAVARWKWERSQDGTSGWAVIAEANNPTYTPKTADVGFYLRATATYSDRDLSSAGSPTVSDPNLNNYNNPPVDNAPIRTAAKVSEYQVKAANNVNQTPVFADDEAVTPQIADVKQQARKVDENSPKGTVVGAPVSAADTDVLKYEWSATGTAAATATERAETPAATKSAFKVDRATGQISVNGDLDFETASSYTGTVIATDPYNSTDAVTVAITVNNVNDAPTFTPGTGYTRATVTENADPITITPTEPTPNTGTFTATDVDDPDAVDSAGNSPSEVVNITITGPDAGAFDLTAVRGEGATGATGVIAFKSTTNIDYETKKSYSVTIVATDARGLSKTIDATIVVQNAEDTGTIKLSTRQPQVGRSITAELTDADGVKGTIEWAWTTGGATGTACPSVPATDASTYGTAISGDRATKQTFTPTAPDVGGASFAATCLLVTASYDDQLGDDKTARMVTANPVLPQRSANRAPVFADQDPDTEGTQNSSATRSVDEDAKSGASVGTALVASDPDKNLGGTEGLNDMPTYSLHGADAATFGINDATGQITRKVKLDHETKPTHSVIVRATDGSGAIASIPVTITVNDVNEPPKVSGPAEVTFQENGTGDVGTYTEDDPEDNAVTWSVEGPDGTKFFSIDSNGVLTFKSPPNFEAKADADTNNVYEVTVVATDTADERGTKSVKVTVTNVDDPPSITFTVVQPGVGVEVTAKLNDQDTADEEAGATYQWAIADSASGPFTNIMNATSATYRPVDGDANKYLQVTATYGPFGAKRTLSKGFDHPVAARDVANASPVFPDQNPAAKGPQTDQEREVPENSKKGTPVGAPVTATDDDVMTYTVDDDGNPDTAYTLFTIDMVSGQLKVGSVGEDLDFEETYTESVKVTATDANGASTDVNVTIIATNVDEKPELDYPAEASSDKVYKAPENQTVIDANTTTVAVPVPPATTAADYQPAQFTAPDPEGGDVTWSVEGADGGKFKITAGTATVGANTVPAGTLAFKSKPDFEAKGSASGTNIYKVTIVASDEAGNRATKSVKVEVTNVNENGSIKISTVQPQGDVPITATLSDPDGIVGVVTWTWTVGTRTAVEREGSAINTFTPPADASATETLTVAVSYEDTLSAVSDTDADHPTRVIAAADSDSQTQNMFVIRPKQTSNRAPRFLDGAGDVTTSYVREVAENTASGEVVGAAVQADDQDTTTGVANFLTYTMSGPDAASFSIGRGEPADNGTATVGAVDDEDVGGQITTKAKLDYEGKNVYMVTVTATDGSGASVSIDVTIMVTDDPNEAPKLAPPAPVVSGDRSPSYAENGTGAVGTYTVSPAAATLSLGGDDMAAFSLTADGVLSFSASPDYEAPTDADGNNVYMVTITGTDGSTTGSLAVAVTVTNVDEDGTVSYNITEPSVGTPITASLTDPDGAIASLTWQWQRSNTEGDFSDIEDATDATYTPVAEDAGNDLRAMASYTDGHGTGKTAATSAGEVLEQPDFDADGDGLISRDEAIAAVQAFFRGEITRDQVLEIIQQYFADAASGN